MKLPLALLTLLAALGSASALADQCEVVTPAQARAALAALSTGTRYFEFCEPCGDAQPGPVKQVSHARSKPFEQPPDLEIEIDGKGVDLAYLYIAEAHSDRKFINVAWLADCPADGVTREIDLKARANQQKPVQRGPGPSPVGYAPRDPIGGPPETAPVDGEKPRAP